MAESSNNVLVIDDAETGVDHTETVLSANVQGNVVQASLPDSFIHFGQGSSSMGFPHYVMLQTEATGTSGNKNMAAPTDSSFFQQQLLFTQKMCKDQQDTLKTLTSTVAAIQKQLNKTDNGRQETDRPSNSVCFNSSDSEIDLEDSQASDPEESEDDRPTPAKHPKVLSNMQETPENRKLLKLKSRTDLFVKEETYGPPVSEEIAKIVNKGLSSQVEHKSEHVKTLLAKYTRPENCEFLSVPKVEKSLWTSKNTNKEIKESDKCLQRTQNYITAGLVPVVALMDKALKSETLDSEEVMDLVMDSFTLLAYSHRDMSCQRKRLLTPAISGKYRALCQERSPISPTLLFGEDLSKQIKDMDESRKLGNDLVEGPSTSKKGYQSKQSSNHRRSEYPTHSGSSNYRSNGNQSNHQKPFLGRKRPHSHQQSYKGPKKTVGLQKH